MRNEKRSHWPRKKARPVANKRGACEKPQATFPIRKLAPQRVGPNTTDVQTAPRAGACRAHTGWYYPHGFDERDMSMAGIWNRCGHDVLRRRSSQRAVVLLGTLPGGLLWFSRMTPKAYKYALRRLGLTQQMAGQVFGMSKRTGQRWARYGPPESVAAVLIMVDNDRHKLDVLLNQSRTDQ